MKILGLDIYKNAKCKINKDVNGGFGTVNDFAASRRGRLLAKLQKKGVDFPPIYLMSMLSVACSQGHSCSYSRDPGISTGEYDLVIMSSSIVCCESELAAVKSLTSKAIPVLVVGPFASQLPELYREAGASVFVGEPDTHLLSQPELLEKVRSQPRATIYKQEINPDISLNDLPPIRWDLYLKNYTSNMLFLGTGTALPVFSSRGCPYSCYNYCTYPLQQGLKQRKFSPSELVDRLEYYKKEFSASKFLFRDPVFTLDRNHVIDICNEILARNLKIWWAAELHLKDIDEDLAQLMHKAGLRCVFVGIETINPESISASKRFSAKKSQQENAIRWLEGNGISVKGMFIFGMPEDNVENLGQTMRFAKKLPVTYLQYSVFTPYPGTPIYSTYESSIKADKYEDYTQWDLIFEHSSLTPQQVSRALDKAYKSSYLSPIRAAKIAKRLFTLEMETRFA
ncbi:MAG: B12-binding domain-containing radical SAM protein [Cyanobacteriota bacterium]